MLPTIIGIGVTDFSEAIRFLSNLVDSLNMSGESISFKGRSHENDSFQGSEIHLYPQVHPVADIINRILYIGVLNIE